MRAYSLSHLSDGVLLRDAMALVSEGRVSDAKLVAHIAEIDSRHLFAAAGYDSMREYCLRELRLSEDAALKRIQVARVARQFPALFPALADGRLHLTAVLHLKPYLTSVNVDELIAAAAGRTKSELREVLAARFPQSELLGLVDPLSPRYAARNGQLVPEPVDAGRSTVGAIADKVVPEPPAMQSKVEAHAPAGFAFHFTVGQSAYEKFQHAQALLSHALPTGDIAAVFERLLDVAIPRLEKAKFAATERPRAARASKDPQRIPAHVQRAVWQRDHGMCTFVSESGHCCGSHESVEFDHVVPRARGGESTIENVRLRCTTHNQLEAERVYGAGFMEEKRAAAKRAAEVRRAQKARKAAEEEAQAQVHAMEQTLDVIAGLRNLGFRADQARRAAESTANLPNATLEARLRAALKCLRPRPYVEPAARATG